MPDSKIDQILSWMDVLSRMLPGFKQAVVLQGLSGSINDELVWPTSSDLSHDLLTTTQLSRRQHKTVITSLSGNAMSDDAVYTIISIPFQTIENIQLTLGILVNIKSSQQTVVVQLIQWGEAWLKLLLDNKSELVDGSTDVKPVNSIAEEVNNESLSFIGRIKQYKNNKHFAVLAIIIFIVLLISVLDGTYRVTAKATLEGRVQRVVVAPFDSYIQQSSVRAGEVVKAGDIVAQLDNQDLLLQQQQYFAQKNEVNREYRQALAKRETAQAHIFKSQMAQAESQLKLIDKKIQRSSLYASIDGVIISGDLSRSLGAPVKTGDVLFEIAPLDEYRLVIYVDEKEVVDVQPGMRGVLYLKSLPSQQQLFTVTIISPVFEEQQDSIAYRVEAVLDKNEPSLRPGMQGITKIDIDQRSYGWIYLHEIYDVIRLWLWSWLP